MTARVLYMPNEAGDYRQLGMRRAFADLEAHGHIDALEVHSLLHRVRAGAAPSEAFAELVAIVRDFRPSIVFAQHLGGAGCGPREVAQLRAAGDFALIYHEADPYAWPLHPLPREARAFGRAADVVFTVGAGGFARNFARAGARDVRFIEWGLDLDRFPDLGEPTADGRIHDAVVIANRNRPRLRGLPNWRDRVRFVELLQERLGARCAVYGRGWEGPGARGPLPFDQQTRAIREAWVSANWDHFARERNYHSDRFAISLAAGTVHATTDHPGFEDLLPPELRRVLLLERTPEALVDSIVAYLEGSTPAERVARMRVGYRHAWQRLRLDDQVVTMLNAAGAGIDPERAAATWSAGRLGGVRE